MNRYMTTDAPAKSSAAERAHTKLHHALHPSGLYTDPSYPVLEIDRGVRITPALVARLLDVLEECEGWMDPECTDGEPCPLPRSVVDAMSTVYRELER